MRLSSHLTLLLVFALVLCLISSADAVPGERRTPVKDLVHKLRSKQNARGMYVLDGKKKAGPTTDRIKKSYRNWKQKQLQKKKAKKQSWSNNPKTTFNWFNKPKKSANTLVKRSLLNSRTALKTKLGYDHRMNRKQRTEAQRRRNSNNGLGGVNNPQTYRQESSGLVKRALAVTPESTSEMGVNGLESKLDVGQKFRRYRRQQRKKGNHVGLYQPYFSKYKKSPEGQGLKRNQKKYQRQNKHRQNGGNDNNLSSKVHA